MSTNERENPPSAWLDDPDAPPTAEELAMLAALGDGLDENETQLADALRAAHSPPELPLEVNEKLILQATAKMKPRGQLIRVAFGAASTVLALAAAYALVVKPSLQMTSASELAHCRSTQELFAEPFPRTGGSSSRIEKISASRERDLRENRFARWGVR
ncbi:MAG: hypothetical protein U0165_05835 [Polyangiaceae bacterium]